MNSNSLSPIELAHEHERMLIKKDGNWDIFLSFNGHQLLAIPSDEGKHSGCAASYYGDKHHLIKLMNQFPANHRYIGFTDEGLALMAGLRCDVVTRRVFL